MKLLSRMLKYAAIIAICYLLVQFEVRWIGVGVFQVFPHDAHKWFDIEKAPLPLTAERVALIAAILPLGWANVLLVHKLFKQSQKAIWWMAIITTYHLVLQAGLFWLLGIPGYYQSMALITMASMIGAWIAAFVFYKKHQQRITAIAPG